ncbi:uncharacterized protein N7469_004943 [Penicillium citrinum]|uniref:Uncharacterized protein n=2 Tax=Penicillium TaxID=5073 RepID=A0A9W9P5M0_PENCI|nr:uncharacterized protein N7469_004943 [Penicillium citrinum]KAJ5235775.1 hypothetical protein N7469_004943 [Penicillium citrinum]KAJ5591339.1 hypothetical protein N7450_005311 [Penicillium hetheringtonii]KAK5799879.1 hypothetical protein VI817_002091 [Penicillium citrinum]
MSTITRAFTKRNKRPEVSAPMPYRGEGHVRFNSGSIKRGNISGPVQLLSTTNMLAYNAPDLTSPNSSSASSLQSREDSDFSISPHSYSSSITSPDVSPHESSPVEANASYFPKRSATVTSHPRSSATSSSSTESPLVPKRALSHTKRSHQELARKRSQHRLSPPPLAAPRSNPTMRASQDMFRADSHPFSKELEQVNEVAEEFGASPLMDEEERTLRRKGLKKFTVDDYLTEIQDLYGSIFDDKLGPLATSWL